MSPPNCHINALLANTNSDNQFNQVTVDRLKPEVDKVIATSQIKVSRALFIYYAAVEENCDVYLKANIQKLFDKIQVECIVPGMEAEMIDQAECIVIGGGSMLRLTAKMSLFASNIWRKVLGGVPFIGVNTGARFLASEFINIPNAACSEFSYFPIQFIPGYSETPQGEADISALLYRNLQLRYALCMPTTDEGGGIVLEDAKSGLAGSQTDWGGGPPPGVGQELYIYERNDQGGIRQVTWTQAQRKDLPINIM